jgi:hypothetical protein
LGENLYFQSWENPDFRSREKQVKKVVVPESSFIILLVIENKFENLKKFKIKV